MNIDFFLRYFSLFSSVSMCFSFQAKSETAGPLESIESLPKKSGQQLSTPFLVRMEGCLRFFLGIYLRAASSPAIKESSSKATRSVTKLNVPPGKRPRRGNCFSVPAKHEHPVRHDMKWGFWVLIRFYYSSRRLNFVSVAPILMDIRLPTAQANCFLSKGHMFWQLKKRKSRINQQTS